MDGLNETPGGSPPVAADQAPKPAKRARAKPVKPPDPVPEPPKPKPVLRTYADLGPMPDDSLAMTEWVHRALGVAFQQVTQDPGVKDERERRKEMTEIAAQMKGLVPQSRIYNAEQMVMHGAAQMSGEAGPEMVDAPQVEHGPASGGRQARRGRPRKRSHG